MTVIVIAGIWFLLVNLLFSACAIYCIYLQKKVHSLERALENKSHVLSTSQEETISSIITTFDYTPTILAGSLPLEQVHTHILSLYKTINIDLEITPQPQNLETPNILHFTTSSSVIDYYFIEEMVELVIRNSKILIVYLELDNCFLDNLKHHWLDIFLEYKHSLKKEVLLLVEYSILWEIGCLDIKCHNLKDLFWLIFDGVFGITFTHKEAYALKNKYDELSMNGVISFIRMYSVFLTSDQRTFVFSQLTDRCSKLRRGEDNFLPMLISLLPYFNQLKGNYIPKPTLINPPVELPTHIQAGISTIHSYLLELNDERYIDFYHRHTAMKV